LKVAVGSFLLLGEFVGNWGMDLEVRVQWLSVQPGDVAAVHRMGCCIGFCFVGSFDLAARVVIAEEIALGPMCALLAGTGHHGERLLEKLYAVCDRDHCDDSYID
jgi:hypothetical protein